MNPRAWVCWTAAALVVVLTSTNPVYRALVLLVAANVLLIRHRPEARLRPLFIAIGVGAVLAVVLTTLLSHTGEHVRVSLPEWVPGIGGPVTAEAALYGVNVAVGITAAILAVAPLSQVLHSHDLLDAFPHALQRTAAMTGAAINLVPAVARNALAISEAQRMRGAQGRRLGRWRGVAAPVVLSALDDSLQLAEAMEARGFGSGPRTRYAGARWDLAAAVVVACALAAAALTVVARATGSLADWYPFPTATLPEVSVLPALACVLLAVPLVAWRS